MAGKEILESAEAGFRLSLQLNALSCEVFAAGMETHSIAKGVSLFVVSLKQAGRALQYPRSIHTSDAFGLVRDISRQGTYVFDQLESMLKKARQRPSPEHYLDTPQEHFLRCFKKYRVTYLLAYLETLKLSLMVIMQTLHLGNLYSAKRFVKPPFEDYVEQERIEIQNMIIVRYWSMNRLDRFHELAVAEAFKLYTESQMIPHNPNISTPYRPPIGSPIKLPLASFGDVDTIFKQANQSSRDMVQVSSYAVDSLLQKWVRKKVSWDISEELTAECSSVESERTSTTYYTTDTDSQEHVRKEKRSKNRPPSNSPSKKQPCCLQVWYNLYKGQSTADRYQSCSGHSDSSKPSTRPSKRRDPSQSRNGHSDSFKPSSRHSKDRDQNQSCNGHSDSFKPSKRPSKGRDPKYQPPSSKSSNANRHTASNSGHENVSASWNSSRPINRLPSAMAVGAKTTPVYHPPPNGNIHQPPNATTKMEQVLSPTSANGTLHVGGRNNFSASTTALPTPMYPQAQYQPQQPAAKQKPAPPPALISVPSTVSNGDTSKIPISPNHHLHHPPWPPGPVHPNTHSYFTGPTQPLNPGSHTPHQRFLYWPQVVPQQPQQPPLNPSHLGTNNVPVPHEEEYKYSVVPDITDENALVAARYAASTTPRHHHTRPLRSRYPGSPPQTDTESDSEESSLEASEEERRRAKRKKKRKSSKRSGSKHFRSKAKKGILGVGAIAGFMEAWEQLSL
ncbi:hypothetical protein FQN57_005899 [Myotisia sp. PD_48]|nr:hypothetical protein FQN57_005899 [Myotisia sp. PD_48]